MASITNYAIVFRQANGQIRECHPSSLAYASVASIITITIGMLSTPRARLVLTEMVLQVDTALRYRYISRADAEETVFILLHHLSQRFPTVVIDQLITESLTYGYMKRTGPQGEFNTRKHSIHLNAGTVAKMRNAANRHRMDHFRAWQFNIANTIFHEIGHLLVTVVGNNRPGTMTPPNIRPDVDGYCDLELGRGEAGRALEHRVLGGTIELYRDPSQGDDQPGIPHLLRLDPHGNQIAWKITQEAIDRTLAYDFRFPYRIEHSPLDPDFLEPLGTTDCEDSTHVANFINMAPHLTRGYGIWVGARSAVRHMPNDPSVGVEEA